jgi:hypothetical protein
MGLNILLAAPIVGTGVGLSVALGGMCLWLGSRASARGLLAIGVGFLLGGLALLAFLLWRTPVESWKFSFIGVLVGLCLVGSIAFGRQAQQ